MRFLLVGINAKYIHSNPAIYSLRAYAARQLEKKTEEGKKAEILLGEYTINQPLSEIRKQIYQTGADWIGFSCYIWNIAMVRSLAGELRKLLPGVPIWLGGPEVSFHEEEVLRQNPAVTGIMSGEGEVTFTRLVEYYLDYDKKELPEILKELPGIVFRMRAQNLQDLPGDCSSGCIVRTLPAVTADMNDLPFLYGSLDDFKNRIVYYETSRGCPFRCAYCLSSVDKHLRYRRMELVRRELEFFLQNEVPQVKFIDRTFNSNHKHCMDILEYIREHDNGITNFHFEIAADILTEDEIAMLRSLRPGLVQLEIGVQSTNEDTLCNVNRRTDLAKVREYTGQLLQNRNIHLHLDLIAGLPGENLRSFIRSFNEVYEMGADELQLGFLKLLRGSPMEQLAGKYGIVCEEEPPYEVLYTGDISYADLLELKAVEEMLELYHNSQQFCYTEKYILPQANPGRPVLFPETEYTEHADSPYAFYAQLAAYYREKKEPVMNSNRSRRYVMLLEFLLRCCGKEEERKIRMLLTMDYYARENAKTRPEFALPQEAFKTQIYDFYKREAMERSLLPDYAEHDWKQCMRMTHLEVLEAADVNGNNAYLFDYRHRSPVTGSARILPLRLDN